MVDLPVSPSVSLSNAKESHLLHQVRLGIFLRPLYFLLREVSKHCDIYSISVKSPEKQLIETGCLYIRSGE